MEREVTQFPAGFEDVPEDLNIFNFEFLGKIRDRRQEELFDKFSEYLFKTRQFTRSLEVRANSFLSFLIDWQTEKIKEALSIREQILIESITLTTLHIFARKNCKEFDRKYLDSNPGMDVGTENYRKHLLWMGRGQMITEALKILSPENVI